MATQIPPWLALDPIAPARIALAANQRKSQEAIAARRAQFEEQQLMAQQEMMYARLAAQERADQRKQQVYQQTHDAALAQQASAAEFRRQIAQQQNDRQMQALRLREQQVEQQTGIASRKLLGTQNFQRDLAAGVPMVEALAKNAPDLFSDHPERITPAIAAAKRGMPPQAFDVGGFKGVYNPATGAPTIPPLGATPLGQESYTAKQILDEAGNPIPGMRAIPGVRSARILPGARSELSPEGKIRALTILANIEQKKVEEGRTKAERDAAALKRNGYSQQLEALLGGAAGADLGKVPGKIDESTPPGEGDLLAPTSDTGAEGELSADEQAMLDEQAPDQTDLTDEEQAALDEGM